MTVRIISNLEKTRQLIETTMTGRLVVMSTVPRSQLCVIFADINEKTNSFCVTQPDVDLMPVQVNFGIKLTSGG